MGTVSIHEEYAIHTDALRDRGVKPGMWPSPSTLARRLRREGYKVLLPEPPKVQKKAPPPGE